MKKDLIIKTIIVLVIIILIVLLLIRMDRINEERQEKIDNCNRIVDCKSYKCLANLENVANRKTNLLLKYQNCLLEKK